MPVQLYAWVVVVLAVVSVKCWLRTFDRIVACFGALAVVGGMLFATDSATQSVGEPIWRIGSIIYGLGIGFLGCALMAISRLFVPKPAASNASLDGRP